jgi:hypothetical protein
MSHAAPCINNEHHTLATAKWLALVAVGGRQNSGGLWLSVTVNLVFSGMLVCAACCRDTGLQAVSVCAGCWHSVLMYAAARSLCGVTGNASQSQCVWGSCTAQHAGGCMSLTAARCNILHHPSCTHTQAQQTLCYTDKQSAQEPSSCTPTARVSGPAACALVAAVALEWLCWCAQACAHPVLVITRLHNTTQHTVVNIVPKDNGPGATGPQRQAEAAGVIQAQHLPQASTACC